VYFCGVNALSHGNQPLIFQAFSSSTDYTQRMKSFGVFLASTWVGCSLAESLFDSLFKGNEERVYKVSDETFKRYDLNKNGEISEQEWQDTFSSIVSSGFVLTVNAEAHKASFQVADADKSGTVSKDEMRAYFLNQFSSTEKSEFQNQSNLEGANLNQAKLEENAKKILNGVYEKKCGENIEKDEYDAIFDAFVKCTETKDAETCASELCEYEAPGSEKDEDDNEQDSTELVKRSDKASTREEYEKSIERLRIYSITSIIITIVQLVILLFTFMILTPLGAFLLLLPSLVIMILYLIEYLRYNRLRKQLGINTMLDGN
jgi:Ca2+-binding EF-hand superfamily protein